MTLQSVNLKEIYTWTPKLVDKMRQLPGFLDVNPALIAMLGYDSPEQVMQLDPVRDVFVDPEEHERLTGEFQQKGRLDGLEVRWKRKDESAITVRLSGRGTSGPAPALTGLRR